MKKALVILALAMTAMLIMASCNSGPTGVAPSSAPAASAASAPAGRNIPPGMPPKIEDWLRNAPEDALIGIGVSTQRTLNMARNTAATRARVEISQQMNVMVRNMFDDFNASSEVDHQAALSFQQSVTRTLSESRLTGSKIEAESYDEERNYWVVVSLSKADTVREIASASESAARLAGPAMANFNAQASMDAEFSKMNSSTPSPSWEGR